LSEAKEKLDVLKLAPAERAAYERWQDDLHLQSSSVASHYGLGRIEGREEGRQGGRDEGRGERTLKIARAMKANGIPPSVVAQSTDLDPEVVAGLWNRAQPGLAQTPGIDALQVGQRPSAVIL
jgi:predicted transposase/invertase (TIGR01784 family)